MEPLKQAQEWFRQAEYDLGTAEAMLHTGRYIYTVFMCHLCLEKALKGLIAGHGKTPPKSHDLIFLLDGSGIEVSARHVEFLDMLNDVSVPTRYPDELERLIAQYPKERANSILEHSREVYQCLKDYCQT